jgi:dimeric dUTPase (all-alpha-NTP-PPase superfamily)
MEFFHIRKALDDLYRIHTFTNQLSGGITSEQLGLYAYALISELVEMTQELNWKPWKKTPQGVDIEKVQDEFADILCFIGVMLTFLRRFYDIDTRMLGDAYKKAVIKNIGRFTSNY